MDERWAKRLARATAVAMVVVAILVIVGTVVYVAWDLGIIQ